LLRFLRLSTALAGRLSLLFAFLLADHWLLRDVASAAQTLEFVPG